MKLLRLLGVWPLLALATIASGEDWPQFRGVNSSGRAVGAQSLPTEIGPDSPRNSTGIWIRNGLDMAEYIGLTTISQSLDESGRVAVEILQARIANPSRPVQHVRLALQVTPRETA